MRSLGLYGGVERLPSLAFNTRDGLQIPFPEELPVNKDTLLQFCANFLSGKLKSPDDSKEMAKMALQSVLPLNPKNKAERKERKTIPAATRGVSEQFGDGAVGDSAVVKLTSKNFEEVVFNEEKDVLLLLHASKGCESCAHFAVYFKRMAERLRELKVPTLEIARMDTSDESPPAHLNLLVGPLPLLLMIPADNKHPPWNFYSGVGKVQPLMQWVQSQSTFHFDLPNLPHLSEKDKEAYKTQVREREEALDAKRRKEKRDMDNADRQRKEVHRKNRKKMKQVDNIMDDNSDAVKRGSGDVTEDSIEKETKKNSKKSKAVLDDNDEF